MQHIISGALHLQLGNFAIIEMQFECNHLSAASLAQFFIFIFAGDRILRKSKY